jgi:hypothetical protein
MVSPPSGYSRENIDGFLETFVRWANDASLEVGITLQMGGILASGTLISGKSYFQGIANEIQDNTKNNLVVETIQHFMHDMSTMYIRSDNSEDLELNFVHLKNVRLILNSPSNFHSEIKVNYWRGKIIHVEAFFLGEVG